MSLKDTTKCLGYQQITSLSAASGLTIPTGTDPTYCLIIPESQAVRWRDDGGTPTASVGMPLDPGTPLQYDGDLNRIKFIEVVAGAKLNVSYYS